jgi:SAM-dependent methyltransferase
MRAAHKIGKLFSGAALKSARDAVHRQLHPIAVNDILRQIDAVGFEKIRQRYGVPGEQTHWPKYLDARRWLSLNIRRAHDLRLAARNSRLNIFDLGSGGGYFLLVARHLGHSGLGLDIDDPAMFGDLFDLFGLQRVIWRIQPFQPLPETAQRFDLITAFSICFNGHKSGTLWMRKEWAFFLNDLKTRFLKPQGEIFLGLNPESHGVFYTPALKKFFLDSGAEVERAKVWFKSLEKIP